jgi:N-acetylglucosaminyl-diphospho-decaprenol L-rhamnosyltransferase
VNGADRPEVSILIVAFRNPDLTLACLESIYAETSDVRFEVLVHDNESDDGTPDAIARSFPQVDLSRDQGNLGFARANNLLARRARGEYLLLLNPDTLVLDGAVQRLVRAARERPGRVPLGGRTLRPDGTVDPSSCWGLMTVWSLTCFALGLTSLAPRSRLLDPESLGRWERDSEREVGIVTGCLALVPRDTWRTLGGFDETFWLYGEDADLSMRARRAGFRPTITPEATITHVVGASSAARGDKVVLVLRSKATLIRKHWAPLRQPIGVGLLVAGVGLRAVMERAARRPPARRGWGHAWRARGEWTRGFGS